MPAIEAGGKDAAKSSVAEQSVIVLPKSNHVVSLGTGRAIQLSEPTTTKPLLAWWSGKRVMLFSPKSPERRLTWSRRRSSDASMRWEAPFSAAKAS